MAAALAFDITDVSALEPASFVPLYAQLAERFGSLIRGSHASLVGKVLPSEAACMDYFKISRPTVRQAMAQLLSQGLITRGRGRGTFVAPQRLDHDLSRAFEDEMRAAKRTVRFKLLERVTVAAPKKVRSALRLPAGAPVERIKRLRLLEGAIFGYEERFVPLRYAALITPEALRRSAIISLIREFSGEPPSRFALTIRSLPADADSARVLGIKRGAPLLSSEHTYFLASGDPVLHGAVLFHGDHYQFSIETAIQAA